MEPDKSLGSGISIPNWMKQKIGDRYDLDDNTAFSPPSQDDNFFHIRYPKTTSRPQSATNYHRINQYLEKQESVASTAATAPNINISSASSAAATAGAAGAGASMTGVNPGSLSRALTGKQFNPTPAPLEFDPDEPPPNLTNRRGSKSLPASPLSSPKGSPKSLRKSGFQNRYFTAAFPQAKADQGYSGWLLSGLLGSREHLSIPGGNTSEPLASITEVGSPAPESHLAVPPQERGMIKSASAAVLRVKEDEEEEVDKPKGSISPMIQKKVKVIKPKPSELREMNFWSPTSM